MCWFKSLSLWLFCPKAMKTQFKASDLGFPGGSDGKESSCNAGDPGSILGSLIFPGEGNGNPPRYSCLGNPKDRGAWRAAVRGAAESDTTKVTWHAAHSSLLSAKNFGYFPAGHTIFKSSFWCLYISTL